MQLKYLRPYDWLNQIEGVNEGLGCASVLQVVSPSCNEELLVKKDQCLVRAFSDSKL